ncbi:MAG TPA: glycoside hydrolase family 35 protein [Vicinamibacteria bacterium]|nr:glycoside hydrolase family 35 protein [Vicinamibacteria bacterium]
MKRRQALGLIVAAPALTPALARSAAAHSFAIQGDRFSLDGRPFVIRSGEMHYARVPREYWRDRMKKMRAMGLNTLCMYSFWNMHEPRPGRFDFAGDLDIATFIRTAQEEGLWVLVRPGPYSCAEWEFGGFPSWLYETPDIKVRTTDPRFLAAASRYMRALLAHIAPLQVTRGGPVLMLQVENEYGSFGHDKEYLGAVRRMIVDSGIEVPLYTSDGSEPQELAGGTLPDLTSVINFGGPPEREFANFAKFRQSVPRMCGEYWVGWFDHWGERHHTGDNKVHLAGIDWMLERGISFNLYMVHGGSNRGFMNGANFATVGKSYEPTISSYDYDSPIDEAGRLAPKFALYRETIRKHLAAGETLPAPPAPLPVIEIPRFALTETAPLLSLLGEGVSSPRPLSFEELGQSYGFVLYRTQGRAASNARLTITEPRDFAVVLQDSRRLATIDRRLGETSATVSLAAGPPLDILVENGGRINFGPRLYEDRKGIVGKVTLDGTELTGWQMFRLPCEDLATLKFKAAPPHGPSFFRGHFELQRTGDTWIDTRGWTKGSVWVNGRNLGRHWRIGPQQTLFCPGVWLRQGTNEIVVLDLYDGAPDRTVAGVTDPVWETHS